MVNIILHIGLPKTATTTLQKDIFPNIPEILFVGNNQSGRNISIFNEISQAVTVKELCDVECDRLNKKINDLWGECDKPILISDESFCSAHNGLDWTELLSNLGKILQGNLSCVIVGVRNPAEAVFSRYVQSYNRLTETEKKTRMNFLMHSRDTAMYKYASLNEILKANFRGVNIEYFLYQKIAPMEYFNKIISFLGSDRTADFFSKYNSKITTTTHISSSKASLFDYMSKINRKYKIHLLIPAPMYKAILYFMRPFLSLTIRASAIAIPILKEDERQELDQFFEIENRKFFEVTNINVQ